MRNSIITAAVVVVTAVGGVALYLGTREDDVPGGELSDALLAAPSDAAALTEMFARFLPADADLNKRQAILDENGFRCRIEAANVEGSTYLSCLRPTEGSGYCLGINYYAYQTADGEIMDILGSPYDASRDRNYLGWCDGPREEYQSSETSAG